MKNNSKIDNFFLKVKYFLFEKKFNGPRASVLALLFVPLVAFPLVLSDYENTATVTSSNDQFESNTGNNSSTVQVTPNAEIILVKEVVNDDGGTLLLTDFSITTDAGTPVFDSGVASGTSTVFTSEKLYVAPGTYSLAEIDVDGYAEGLWSCDAGVLSKNAFDGGELTLDIGESAICTIINDDIAPMLTLVKQVINDNGGLLSVADFVLSAGAGTAISGVAQAVTANTPITIGEAAVAGYPSSNGWSCTDANLLTGSLPTAGAAAGVDLTLAPGADVTCTVINNDLPATLTLVKNVVNDHGGALTVADFALSVDGGPATSGVSQTVSANTAIVIGEATRAGYSAAAGWSCVDANNVTTALPTAGAAGGVDVNLLPGSDVTCEITNDDIEPTLTLVKNVVNDHGGALTVSDFDLAMGSTSVPSGVAQTVTANTGININETTVPGYSAVGGWSCTDANSITTTLPTAGAATGVNVSLLPGSDVTCEITNDDIEPMLTLVKNVVNDHGGALTVSDFALALGTTSVPSGVAQAVTANTAININETIVPGYSAASGWSCTDANNITATLPTAGAAAGADVSLLPGSDVTCEITNDDIEPTLTLVKNVVNDNGGALAVSDFELTMGTGSATSGVSQPVVANTAINISEITVTGYSAAGGWSCADANSITTGLPTAGTATGVDVTLLPGSDVTCEITNDDVAASLTLVKNVVNDHGGALTAGDFALTIGAGPATSGIAQTVGSNTPITISEVPVAGYASSGGWSCADANSVTTVLPTAGAAAGVDVNLLPGSDVTCEITNDDIEPMLTLVKNVVNDHGGELTVSDFALAMGSTSVPSGVAQTVTANTPININETIVPGYSAASGWACTDANSITTTLPSAGSAAGVNVSLLPGSDVTCEITNDDVEPMLTLVKNVVNDNGGELAIADFDLLMGSTSVPSGVAQTVTANTGININEVIVPGYSAAGGWSCTDANSITTTLPTAGAATGVNVSLLPGSDVTCEITNDDVAATLTLVKNVVNDNGGALTVSDFDLSIDAGTVTSGVAQTVGANTPITISEVVVPGYSAAGGWSCKDVNDITSALPTAGDAAGVDVNLLPGSEVVCSIINDDVAPLLTLVKNVVNDNGGALTIADFPLSIGSGAATSGASQAVAANTAITIAETSVTGYVANSGWACTDANGLTTTLPSAGAAAGVDVTLLPGSDVTCEITNNDLGIDLAIAKVVSNPTPNIGDTITFTLTVTNSGPDVATNATVNDVVNPGFTYVAGSISGGTSSDDTDPTGAGLGWTLASVPVGTVITLTFDVTVNAP